MNATLRAWLIGAATVIGVLALAALVWFGLPLIAIGESRPFDEVWVRALIIGVIVAIALGFGLFKAWQRRKALAALERGISEQEERESDAEVLQQTMRDALATLRKAQNGKKDYLYELPWYLIIGPPGSGKTTALVNSGLKFPLMRGGSPEAVAGIGGTRYCDWWFTDEAVLIDTAGRYTTQDSDARVDRASWVRFLELLKQNRPKQPINGVLVAISLEDILTLSQEEVAAHATAIRKRLLELHEHLRVDFPVYALFTKADLVAGFVEFFGHLSENDRRMVWGHTFQTDDKTRNMIGEVPAEFDALIERLNQQLVDKMQDEPTPTSRVLLFGFPSQMAAARRAVTDFLNRVFEPTRYHTNATLRGFYYSSGTQQGTPIDQLIGALSKSFGGEEVGAAAYSGLGKSYFITDLLKKVVFGEAGWVSTNRAAIRRAGILRAAAFGMITLLAASAAGLWWISYTRNQALITDTNTAIEEYRTVAGPTLRELVVADRDFGRVLPLLHKLRYLPAGYGVRDLPTPLAAQLGLSQRERLQSASESAYEIGLERLFRSRLILRMEEQMEANRTQVGFLYEALKVYLMLGGKAPIDRDLVLAWMRRDWQENLYPGAANAGGRQALEDHLFAMLDLDLGREPAIQLNGPLVENAQRTLARLSIAERAYELLKSQARGQTHLDWVAAARGGPDMRVVFETVSGEDLDTVRVPYFYTYEGFNGSFIDRLGDINDAVQREQWVLGEAGQQAAVLQQYGTLFGDILKLYTRDFVEAWRAALSKLKMRPLTADRPRYVALAAASAATSPIKQLLESLRDETRLTRERPQKPGAQNGGGGAAAGAQRAASRAAVDAAERAAQAALPPSIGGAVSQIGRGALEGRAGAASAAGGGTAPRGGLSSGEAPGQNIEALFKQFHILVEGDQGKRATDDLLRILSEINQNLTTVATYPQQAAQANAALVSNVAALRAIAPRFPPPFEPMIRTAANDFEGDATGASISQLAEALADQVTRVCQQIVEARYPFDRRSDREVPPADFGRLFAPQGIIDKFFTANLESLADRSKANWAWRQQSQLGRSLSPTTLRAFQQAAQIRDAFFPTGGVVPNVEIQVTPLTLSGDVSKATFDINGQIVTSQQGVNAPVKVTWPGPGAGRSAITLTLATPEAPAQPGLFGAAPAPAPPANPDPAQTPTLERQGSWSLFRMLDAGRVLQRGDGVSASFLIGGREVSYQMQTSSSGLNPLALQALREFRCPTGV